jgi:50S ribosomal protein L16 3-hydroxylase
LQHLIEKVRPSRTDISLFLGEYLSEPKPNVRFQPKKISPRSFHSKMRRHGIQLNKQSLMLYQGSYVFLNGESFLSSRLERPALRLLADQGYLSPEQCQLVTDPLLEQCLAWAQCGWLDFGSDH